MEKKIRIRFNQILNVKPAKGYNHFKKLEQYNNISMEIDILLNYQRKHMVILEMLLEKLKRLVLNYDGYFTENKNYMSDSNYSFRIHIISQPVEAICKIYHKIYEFLKFSKGLLSSRIEDGMEIHFFFLKNKIYDINKSHIDLLSYMIDHKNYFQEGLFNSFKVLPYNEYLKYQLDVSGKYLAINYLNSDYIEIRNLKSNLSVMDISVVLVKILGILYYEQFTFQERRKYKIEKVLDENLTHQLLTSFLENQLEQKEQKLIKNCLKNNSTLAFSYQNGIFTLVEITPNILEKIEQKRYLSYR